MSARTVVMLGLLFAPAARAAAPMSHPAPRDQRELSARSKSPPVWREKLAELSRNLDPYRIDGDLRTHVFFRYADAPYTRATIACLLMAERVLADESGAGPRGASLHAGSARVGAILRWSEAALAHVRTGSPFDFQDPSPKPRTPTRGPRIWWVADSRQPAAPGHDFGAELDLVACLGTKRFVDTRADVAQDLAEALRERAEFLGVVYEWVGQTPVGSHSPDAPADHAIPLPRCDYDPEAVEHWRSTLWLPALSGRRDIPVSLDGGWSLPWLLEVTAHCGLDFMRLAGVLGRFPGLTDVAIVATDAHADRTSQLQAGTPAPGLPAALCDALADVQVSADIIGPDAMAEENLASRYRVLILADVDRVPPAMQEQIRRFRDAGNVLMAVGKCLNGVPRSGPGGIGFDLELAPDSLGRLGEYVRRLRERGTILADQVVPVSADGGLVRGLRSGTATAADGTGLVYVVNLTNAPSSLAFRHHGRPLTGHAQELVSDRAIELTQAPLVLPPHAIWILQMPVRLR